MQVRIRETGAVVYESEFRAMHPNTSMPQQLSEALINDLGADVVLEGPQAVPNDPYLYSQYAGVEQIDGKWYTKYVLGPVFVDTVVDGVTILAAQHEANYREQKDIEQAKAVRALRNAKLAETDWRFRSDMNPSQEWKDYCQALRDISTQVKFPWDIQWPTQPE